MTHHGHVAPLYEDVVSHHTVRALHHWHRRTFTDCHERRRVRVLCSAHPLSLVIGLLRPAVRCNYRAGCPNILRHPVSTPIWLPSRYIYKTWGGCGCPRTKSCLLSHTSPAGCRTQLCHLLRRRWEESVRRSASLDKSFYLPHKWSRLRTNLTFCFPRNKEHSAL